MTRIKVPCPKCGHVATVEIATIDRLRAEVIQLRGELWAAKHRDDPITPEWFEKMLRGGL